MDNLETRDTRQILPNTLFSVEPRIYLPESGVRSEVSVLGHNGIAQVTGRQQEELGFSKLPNEKITTCTGSLGL